MNLKMKTKKRIYALALAGSILACGLSVSAKPTASVSTSYGNTTITGNGVKTSSQVTFGAHIYDPDDIAYTGQVWAYAAGVTSKIYTVVKSSPVYAKKFNTSSSTARVYVNVNGHNPRSCELTN